MPPNKAPEGPKLSERQEATRQFLLSKMNVCPYGRDAARADSIIYTDVPSFNAQAALKEPAERFIVDRAPALIAISPTDPENHEHGRIEAYNLFADMGELFDRLGDPFRPEAERQAEWNRIRTKAITGEPIHVPPGFDVRGPLSEHKYAVAMGPQFGEGHPRWSPHSMVVVIWNQDLAKATMEQRDVNFQIQKRMRSSLKECGVLRGDPDGESLIPADGFYSVSFEGMSSEEALRIELADLQKLI